MYTILHESDPPTAVNLSVTGSFLPFPEQQLVTVGAKYLRVFRLNHNVVSKENKGSNNGSSTKFECFYSTDLMAPVRSISVARLPSHTLDSLVLAFDDAKLSLINFNVSSWSFNTVSLHSFEDEVLKDGFTETIVPPMVTTDPLNRCTAMLVYGRHLAVLPFTDGKQLQSYTISLRSLDVKLDNVIAMVFLHGYYEPTLLLVYEPIRTTAGRATIRYDTVSILAVSLNLKDHLHAVVWNVSGLPMSIHSCLAVPQPVGGICLFGANEIVYLNQSVPPCGVSLNSNADEFCRFPLSDLKSLKMTLDACEAEVINESEIFVSTRTGQLFHIHLDVDISHAVKSLELKRVYDVSIPHTITFMSPNYLFVGSRLGDSQLLQFTREQVHENGTSAKKLKLGEEDEDLDDFLYGDNLEKVEEDVEVVGENKLVFNVLDTLVNVGPCKVLRAANPANISNEFKEDPKDLYFDLVTLSGHEKDSSMCFFQRSVRPNIISSSPLEPYAVQLWTVGKREDGSQKYLVVSYERSTVVLELKESDLDTMEDSPFLTKETTICAGEISNGRVSVQICPMSINLIGNSVDENDIRLDTVVLDSNFPVATASIADPYLLLVTQNGKVRLYKYDENSEKLEQISTDKMFKDEKSPVTSACMYKDVSGIFVEGSGDNLKTAVSVREESPEPMEGLEEDEDDLDALLYGGDKPETSKKQPQKRKADDVKVNGHFDTVVESKASSTHWIVLTKENGNLYIFNTWTLDLVYFVKKLNQLPQIVKSHVYQHELEVPSNLNESVFQTQESQLPLDNVAVKQEEVIQEVQINGLGYNKARPVLSLLVDDTVYFYEIFSHDEGTTGTLNVRFNKVHHNVVTRSAKFVGPNGRAPVEAGRETDQQRALVTFYERLGHIRNGLVIGGNYPCVLVSDQGHYYLHPFTIDGFIYSIAPYTNEHCRNGFIYITGDSNQKAMRIAELPVDYNYQTSYPVKKVPFDETLHHMVYLMNWDVFVVVTSYGEPNTKVCSVVNEEKHVEEYERDDSTFIIPQLDRYKLQLFSTEDWSYVPNSLITFNEFEVITCVEEVLLSSESTMWGVQSYLAIGTAISYGEEVFVRGRILLYEIIQVVPEEGMPTTRHKLKNVYDKEQKGPVTSMCHLNGYLLTGMGQKIFIWQFKDGMLNGVSFLDMHFYIHNLVAHGSLALACDMFQSLSLVQYQKNFKALSLVSRDLRPNTPSPMAAQFILDRTTMGFVLADEVGNVSIFNHLPETNESNGGERLILRAGLNIGTAPTSFVRVKGHVGEAFLIPDLCRESHTCLFSTLDGSFGWVRPLSEKTFRRFQMLQQLISSHIPQVAGLNPKGSKAPKPQKTHQQITGASRFVIDANLILQYEHLSLQEKSDLSKNIGSSRFQIMDDITELKRVTSHF